MSIKKYLLCSFFLPIMMFSGTSNSFVGAPNFQLSDTEDVKNGYIILAKNEEGGKKPKEPKEPKEPKKPNPNECEKPKGGMCPNQPIERGKCPAGCNKVNKTECSCRFKRRPTSPPTTQTLGGSFY